MASKRTVSTRPTRPRSLRFADWERLNALCAEESNVLGVRVPQGLLVTKALKHYATLPLAVRVGLKEK